MERHSSAGRSASRRFEPSEHDRRLTAYGALRSSRPGRRLSQVAPFRSFLASVCDCRVCTVVAYRRQLPSASPKGCARGLPEG
jgi:hypothetical protein